MSTPEIQSIIDDTRRIVGLSHHCNADAAPAESIILSLATQLLLARRALQKAEDTLRGWDQVHDDLFTHCLSNGVFNRWGNSFDCTKLNDVARETERLLSVKR